MKPKYRIYFRNNHYGPYIAIWSINADGFTEELVAMTNQLTNKLQKL